MKKTYEKPSVLIENFELDQDIALGCTAYKPGGGNSGIPKDATKEVCAWLNNGMWSWHRGTPACKSSWAQGDGGDKAPNGDCYSTSSSGNHRIVWKS